METTSIARLQLLHPKIRDKAIDAYHEAVNTTPAGIHPFITQTVRTFEESDHLYQLGRTIVNPDGKSAKKPMGNIVSNAKAGQSWHNYALGLDFVIQKNGKESWDVDANWMVVVNIFKAHGFTWGGDFSGSFKDYPHLENKLGYTLSQMQAKHAAKDFILGTEYLNL